MPETWNGIGTFYHGNSAPVRWEKAGRFTKVRPDHDAVECLTVFFLPVFPLRAYHTHRWTSDACAALHIQRSTRLLLRAMLRPYLLGMLWAGGIMCSLVFLLQLAEWLGPKPQNMLPRLWLFGSIFLLGALGTVLFNKVDHRFRDIRLLLGPHDLGSSDPATWFPETREKVRLPALLRDQSDMLRAGQEALVAGHFSEAMFAARLAVATGDLGGEELTENILRDLRVVPVLGALRKAPWRRSELLAARPLDSLDHRVAEKGESPRCLACGLHFSEPKSIVRFYDGHDYCASCLDNVGGPGLSEMARAEPVLERQSPDAFRLRVFCALMFVFCVLTVVQLPKAELAQYWYLALLIPTLPLAALVAGAVRVVKLGNCKLQVKPWGKACPLGGQISVKRSKRLTGPVTCVQLDEVEISWPNPKNETEDIDRALRALSVLKDPDAQRVTEHTEHSGPV